MTRNRSRIVALATVLSLWLVGPTTPLDAAPQNPPSVDLSPASWPEGEWGRLLEQNRPWGRSKPVAHGKHGMVAGTTQVLAQRVGVEALHQGGTAMDAACATALTQIALAGGATVSYAGIMVVVYYEAASGEVHAMMAPFAVPLAEDDPLTIPGSGVPSGRTALVPGFMKGLEAVHRRFGRLPFASLFGPAIHLAEEGIAVEGPLAGWIRSKEAVLSRLPATRAVFAGPDGGLVGRGDVLRQTALAETLRAVARDGADHMYTGPWARAFVDAVTADGGKATMEDLRRYEVIWSEPLRTTYRELELCAPTPPMIGGEQIIDSLNLLELANPAQFGHYTESAEALYWLIQCDRVAYMMRSVSAEDLAKLVPGASVETEARISKENARLIWEKMKEPGWMQRVQGFPSDEDETGDESGGHSDGVVVVDAEGNVAAMCHTINTDTWGGTGLCVGGVSIPDSARFQQVRMLAAGPGGYVPNEMNPLIVLDGGKPVLACSCVGSGLHDATVGCLHNILDFGMEPREATETPTLLAPYWISGPEGRPQFHRQVVAAGRFDDDVLEGVRALGQPLAVLDRQASTGFRGYWIGIAIDPESGECTGGVTPWFNGAVLAASDGGGGGDWPMWGRDESRRMCSDETGLPGDFAVGKFLRGSDEIDPETTRNVRWVARLGSESYGNPTVSGGKVFVGTNNGAPRDPRFLRDRSCVYCFDEATGEFLWQLNVPKLGTGMVSDWDHVGICSSPSVEGERVFLVTNRCEVICLDVDGLADGNDGAFQDEAAYLAGPGEDPIPPSEHGADILWVLDMTEECGVQPHNITSSSVLIAGDVLWVTTSNGADIDHQVISNPEAPSLILVDKATGLLLAEEASGISSRMFHASWSSPAYLRTDDVELCIFGAPDGFCYAFAPGIREGEDGRSSLEEVWRVDCNPEDYRVKDDEPVPYGDRRGPSEVLGTPATYEGKVYCTIGQEPDHGAGYGNLICVSAAGEVLWSFSKINRTMSSLAIGDGLLYATDYSGFVYCLDAETGEQYWKHDTMGHIWGSPLLADGKVYVGNEDGYLTILRAGKEYTKDEVVEIDVVAPVYSSAVAANGVLYVATATHLFAIAEAPEEPPPPPAPEEPGKVEEGGDDEAAAALPEDWPISRGNAWLAGVAGGRLPEEPSLLWSFDAGKAILSSPVVAGQLVYFGADDFRLHCVDATTGKGAWNFVTEDVIEAPPLVVDGKVFVGSSDYFLYALDALDGELLWKYETDDRIIGGANYHRGPDGLRVVVGSHDCHLYCFAAESGELLWKYASDNFVNGTPAIHEGRAVFGGCDAVLHVVDIEKGIAVSRVELGDGCHVPGSVGISEGRVYLGHYGNEFVCVDLDSGEIAWVYPGGRHPFFSSPSIGSDRVVFGGRDKNLHCARKADGEPQWKFPTRRKVDGSPVIVGDEVVFGSSDGRVYVLGLEDGQERWSYEIGQPIVASPAVAGGMIYVGGTDGVLYAFGSGEDR